MNTFGLFSINTGTFNEKWHTNETYPEEFRNILVTFLRVHNLFLNVLGYAGGNLALVSGSIRIVSGFGIVATTLAIGDRNAPQGAIIGHWYDEAVLTGIAQISRGILEAFVPYGRAANACLDIASTFKNVMVDNTSFARCGHCNQFLVHAPHWDPEYPFPLSLLSYV